LVVLLIFVRYRRLILAIRSAPYAKALFFGHT
jgi:hypothetical protein